MAVIYYFEQKDIDAMLKFLNLMFYINTIIMLIQFFVLGYKQDQLGGIFGVESGCNAYINIFFCVILVINYVGFFQRRVKLGTFLLKALTLLIVSGMAELKFFYIEFIVLILSGFLVLKGYTKKVLICIGGIVIFEIGLHAIHSVFPDIEMGIMQLLEYATNENGYTASGDLNRLFFFSQVNRLFLITPLSRLLGLGLGNCDYASGSALLTSPFAATYQNTLHYGWISTAFIYLEAGYAGLFFFFGFFVSICVFCYVKSRKSSYMQNTAAYSMGFLLSLSAIMNGLYNISLRLESCYIIYGMLAIPFMNEMFDDQ